jgi:hypothetical protein
MTSYGKWVHSCSEEGVETHCQFCGNCLKFYFRKIEMMKNQRRSDCYSIPGDEEFYDE